jgi:hypothetical protein
MPLYKEKMKTHDKIQLAGEMLATAAQDYKNAKNDMDYVKCILMAGAVINIAYPLVKQFGGSTQAAESAKLATRIMEIQQGVRFGKKQKNQQIARFMAHNNFIYNSLKHAGDTSRNLKPSDDINFDADLKVEAEQKILDAKAEFSRLPLAQGAINKFSDELHDFLSSNWPA